MSLMSGQRFGQAKWGDLLSSRDRLCFKLQFIFNFAVFIANLKSQWPRHRNNLLCLEGSLRLGKEGEVMSSFLEKVSKPRHRDNRF